MENVRFVDNFLKNKLPQIKAYEPQASFLIWLDCKGLGLSQPELTKLFKDKAGLALNDGSIFGKEGEGYMRMNIGCPRSVIEESLNRLKKAVEQK
jgi:cystathionine beta-lyase